jgi:MOSC domain-containing protein YiiM
MIASGSITAVHVGPIARLAGAGRRGADLFTAYRKSPVAGPVTIDALGLQGDAQGNRRVHGGPDKAVYGYPGANYAGWRADFPDIAERFVAGAMGENLVIAGLAEAQVHIGDVIRCGSARLQVSQIREPCGTFAAVLGTPRVVRAMIRSGRCGWYYRVLEPGVVSAGDDHAIVERPNPGWPVSRFAAFAAGAAGTQEALAELAALPGLTPAWQLRAANSLAAQRAGA